MGTGSAGRVETLKNSFQNGEKPIEAIGSRWGVLAVRDSPESETIGALNGGSSSLSEHPGVPLHPVEWPSIEEGAQVGKGARRRLTLVPQKFSEWCVDASGYHPTTRGEQKKTPAAG
jgi:hypothetical protein